MGVRAVQRRDIAVVGHGGDEGEMHWVRLESLAVLPPPGIVPRDVWAPLPLPQLVPPVQGKARIQEDSAEGG